jgi:dolichol-phosphate mannosyltransferase
LGYERPRFGLLSGFGKWAGRAPLWGLALIFSLPLIVAFAVRFFAGYWWWRDFDAVLCAGVRHGQGLPIYAGGAQCAGLQPSDYVYPPQLAWLAGRFVQHVGVADLRLGFLLVQIAACAFLAWLMFGRRLPHISLRSRLPALGLWAGGVIACGNLAIACTALAAASLLAFRRTRVPFIAAVALISVIKPVYATYLVVLLLDKVPWRQRLARGALGALAIAAVGLAVWRTAPPADFLAWQDALHRVVVHGNPGGGLLGVLGLVGLPAQGPLALAAFALFAALMTAGGVAIAESRGGALRGDERWLFGLGLAQLIDPRPMGYDLLVLAPAIALIGVAADDLSPGFGRTTRRGLVGLCVALWASASVNVAGPAAAIAPPALSLAVLAVGFALAWRRLRPPAVARASSDADLAAAEGQPLISLVICTLDEHEAIGGVIEGAGRALAGAAHEIIVVDDSADERTADAELATHRSDVRLIRRVGERGLAGAAIAGWDASRGRILGLMDGDGQHDPAMLRTLWERLKAESADVALASRYARPHGETGLTGFRDRISRIGTRLTHLLLGVRVTDPLSGLFLMRRSWFEHVRPRLSGVGFKILVDVIASGSRPPRTAETPTRLLPRAGGASKLDVRVMADLAGLLVEKLTRGLVSARLALFLAVGLAGVGVHMATLGLGRLAGAPFWAAQGLAIVVAMTSNFFLNNALTFRQARLTGQAALRGLGVFYASCLAGAVLNEGLADIAHRLGAPWTLAALSGLLAGALCNYALAARLTWGIGGRHAGADAGIGPAAAGLIHTRSKSL